MSKSLTWNYAIRWANPYTRPPDDRPELVAASGPLAPGPWGGSPACPPDLADQYQALIGSGYGLFLSYQSTVPPRQFSLATKQRIRRQRLERRVRSKYPLFADQFIAAELARRPEYFGETQ